MPITFGPSKSHPSYNTFLIENAPLGDPVLDGGYLICCNGGGTAWIVAPASTEVSRNWYCRDDAVTTATNCTSATGWFVPTCCQLKNPGYECKTYWDSYISSFYWSSTHDGGDAYGLDFSNGCTAKRDKASSYYVRAFRCVCY